MAIKCSINKKFNGYTCFSDEQLDAIVRAYARHSGGAGLEKLPTSQARYNALIKQLRITSGDEREILRKSFMYSIKEVDKELYYDIMLNTFAPKAPQCCPSYNDSPTCCPWLSNFDIMRIMFQYQKKYPRFLFLDAPSSDFKEHDIYQMSRSHFNYREIAKNYDQFAAVINLDLRHEGGSHWVALFCDIPSHSIYFFDSTGHSPYYKTHEEPYIVQFMLEVASEMTSTDCSKLDLRKKVQRGIDGHVAPNLRILINRFQHQKGNTECGVYSIYTIAKLLEGKDFIKHCREIVPDKEMAKRRAEFFNAK